MNVSISKKLLWQMLVALCFTLKVYAQNNSNTERRNLTISLTEQLKSFYDISLLPHYLTNTVVSQTSTYDTTGGNNDGFNGTYSFVRRDKDSNLVIFDCKGAGVINRIWTPTPGNDTLDFYIDDTSQVTFSIKYSDLFTGKIYPFVKPLCGNELGGYYCYLPVPFQAYCKILCRARQTQFHQIQYRLYPAGTTVKRFSPMLNKSEKSALQQVADLWNKDERTLKDFYKEPDILTNAKSLYLLPGKTETLLNIEQGGRILELSFDRADLFEGLQKLIDIKITWDDEPAPAVYCPLADLFGYAFGKISMKSLLLGTNKNRNFCFIPMPFDKHGKIELIYRKSSSEKTKPLRINAVISFTKQKRNPATEGKFYACWNSNKLLAQQPSHIFVNATGKGHYIGSLLFAQGLQSGMTYFFEGDDSTATDNIFRIHGTGSEDYFNGGWYAFPDRWSAKLSLPLHGALDYSLPFCRTAGYRFYLGDKLSFEKSIYQSIEHGGENNKIPVNYTSLAFYYCNRPPVNFLKPSNGLSLVYNPDTMILYPQLMKFTVWDNIASKAAWLYNTGGQSFTFSANDESRLKISLEEIPDGEYMLYTDITSNEKGCTFSLWQGQTQISEWISTNKQGEEQRSPREFACKIAIQEFYRSLSIHFKTNEMGNNLLLSRLIFVRKK